MGIVGGFGKGQTPYGQGGINQFRGEDWAPYANEEQFNQGDPYGQGYGSIDAFGKGQFQGQYQKGKYRTNIP